MFDKSKIGSKMSLRSPSPQPAKLHLLDGEFFTKLGVIFVVLNNGLINKVFQKKRGWIVGEDTSLEFP